MLGYAGDTSQRASVAVKSFFCMMDTARGPGGGDMQEIADPAKSADPRVSEGGLPS